MAEWLERLTFMQGIPGSNPTDSRPFLLRKGFQKFFKKWLSPRVKMVGYQFWFDPGNLFSDYYFYARRHKKRTWSSTSCRYSHAQKSWKVSLVGLPRLVTYSLHRTKANFSAYHVRKPSISFQLLAMTVFIAYSLLIVPRKDTALSEWQYEDQNACTLYHTSLVYFPFIS